jgi:hypothetical protein
MTDDDLSAATRYGPTPQEGTCAGSKTVERAAYDAGASVDDIHEIKDTAEDIVEQAANTEADGHGSRVDVAKSTKGLWYTTPRRTKASSLATRFIADAILRSRTGHTAVDSHRKSGRLDGHGLVRTGYGDTRVFEKRTAPSPGKFDIWVMIDCSGSMSTTILEAAQVAHSMVAATRGTPTVRMTVWGWTDPFRPSNAHAGVVKVWETGMSPEAVYDLTAVRMGGTPDAIIMAWAGKAILRDVRADEKPVIIFVSDGCGYGEMTERVTEARRAGVDVKSVSFGVGFSPAAQLERFGRGNVVPFAGTITATARGLGALFAKIVSGR